MSYRLSTITTRAGDGGETGLADGSRLSKSDAQIHLLGEIDELNSVLGLLLAELGVDARQSRLLAVQHELFELGADVAVPLRRYIGEQQLQALEQDVVAWNATLPPLREFILPGGCKAAAWAHLARTVCRRAERWVVMALPDRPDLDHALRYLNRLSDWLFVLARILNVAAATSDVLWQPVPKASDPHRD
ncbi:cob(I)alamin adenosyltransferase [Chitinivorax tropicus]|uniref:Cobalamin adenosyltransferase n=1 Tax=Chitinivorax tropicus TaxID=714531 RepID=A0A840MSW2_9PROT|nr:cob(I)yrinic acid a,c-diamide adenosyltransferase [Chitinivorax tropicus]MBB5019862.1 cob(I)alamin adenosyltransferase [Chitinivorax tropicus]